MRSRWIRNRPDLREDLGAGIVAATLALGVGLATFYVTRLLMAREPLDGDALPARRSRPDQAEVEEV